MNRAASRWFLFLCLGATFAAAQTGPPALTLRGAAERALAHAPEIAVSRADAEEAGASARLARAGLNPQAFATTTPGYSTGLPVLVAGQVPSVFGLEVRKTIYDPTRRARVFDAEALAAAARGTFDRASAATARAAALSYGRVWAGEKRLAGARRRIEAREAIFRHVSGLRREGRRTDLEVENVGLAVARAKQKLLDQQAELDLDRLELARLMDWPSGAPIVPAEDPLAGLPEPPAGDPLAAARAADPELRAFSERIDALEHSLSLTMRSFRPTVEGQVQYLRMASFNNFDQYFVKFKENNFTVGVAVAVPLWSGGRQGEARATARARLDRAQGERRVRERDLELAVRRVESQSLRSGSEAALARRAAGVAREELRVARILADDGRGEPEAVESREIALADAEDDEWNAAQGLLDARLKLFELRGDLVAVLAKP